MMKITPRLWPRPASYFYFHSTPLPHLVCWQALQAPKASLKVPVLACLVPAMIGFGIASAIYHFGSTSAYDGKIETAAVLDLQWPLFAAVLISWLTRWINFYPATLKSAAMDGKAKGNIRVRRSSNPDTRRLARAMLVQAMLDLCWQANLYLFKVNVEESKNALPPVILEDEGTAGMYNRANRSLHHYVENMPGLLLCFAPAGFCFPFPVLVVTAIFCVGRVLHQTGYTNKGYGGHGLGFALSLTSTVIIEGLVLLAGLKAVGVPV